MKRLTVISDTRSGLIADISSLLAEAGINIEAIEAIEVAEKACIRLEVDDLDRALNALNRDGMTVVAEDVLLLRVPDQPGSLAQISRQLADADIQIRALTMVQRGETENIVALACEDGSKAGSLLGDCVMH
jgi:hypothetical protein